MFLLIKWTQQKNFFPIDKGSWKNDPEAKEDFFSTVDQENIYFGYAIA